MSLLFVPDTTGDFLAGKDIMQETAMAAAKYRNALAYGDPGVLGWVRPAVPEQTLAVIKERGAEIREKADALVVVGVGGSNLAARAAISALAAPDTPEIVYTGNNLSPRDLDRILRRLENRNIYVNVIAKDFTTFEPGICYRVIRQYMRNRYGKAGMGARIIHTGTPGSRLETMARDIGCLFLPFPKNIFGRFAALTPVGLFPMAAAGLDIDAILAGAENIAKTVTVSDTNPVAAYVATRRLLYARGLVVEIMGSFDPGLAGLGQCWRQAFGESDGKGREGIFPTTAVFSEDLHSIGQYIQDGRRILFETFLTAMEPGQDILFEPDPGIDDGFDYLNGKRLSVVNATAQAATMAAHRRGGVPCLELRVGRVDEQHFGMLLYFFMAASVASARAFGMDPFNQPGVGVYKRMMNEALGRRE